MINKITVDTTGMTDKQAVIAFIQALIHRRKYKVKQHLYESNTLNVLVKMGKTIVASMERSKV